MKFKLFPYFRDTLYCCIFGLISISSYCGTPGIFVIWLICISFYCGTPCIVVYLLWYVFLPLRGHPVLLLFGLLYIFLLLRDTLYCCIFGLICISFYGLRRYGHLQIHIQIHISILNSCKIPRAIRSIKDRYTNFNKDNFKPSIIKLALF